jgi:hypothetical protein
MSRIVSMLVCLFLTVAAMAAEPVAVVKPDFADLLPGTRYALELRAKYVILEPKRIQGSHQSGVESLEGAKLIIESPQVLRMNFVAGDPKTYPKNGMQFTFDEPLPPAPRGMVGGITYVLKMTITPPPSAKMPTVTRETRYGFDPPNGTIQRCFRLRGPALASGFFFTGVDDCAKAVPTPPPGSDRPRSR